MSSQIVTIPFLIIWYQLPTSHQISLFQDLCFFTNRTLPLKTPSDTQHIAVQTAVNLGHEENAPSLAKHRGAEAPNRTGIAQRNSAYPATKEQSFEDGIKTNCEAAPAASKSRTTALANNLFQNKSLSSFLQIAVANF